MGERMEYYQPFIVRPDDGVCVASAVDCGGVVDSGNLEDSVGVVSVDSTDGGFNIELLDVRDNPASCEAVQMDHGVTVTYTPPEQPPVRISQEAGRLEVFIGDELVGYMDMNGVEFGDISKKIRAERIAPDCSYDELCNVLEAGN